MEREIYANGTVGIRQRNSRFHRLLDWLGGHLLGIGPTAEAMRNRHERWWDRDEMPSATEASPRLIISQTGTQGELWNSETHTPSPALSLPAQPSPAVHARTMKVEMVAPKSAVASRRRLVATTRVAVLPVAVAQEAVEEVAQAQAVSRVVTARAGLGFHLVRSGSISSGQEEGRWISVPRRPLLPRYRLFEGREPVSEDSRGRIHIEPHSIRTLRGHVWFV